MRPTLPTSGPRFVSFRPGLLFCALALASAPLPADWASLLTFTDLPRAEYRDQTLLAILRDIEARALATAHPAHQSGLRPLEFIGQTGADLERRLSLTVPELAAEEALAWVVRQAGYRSERLEHRFFIFPRGDPTAGLAALEEELLVRNLFFSALLEPDPPEFELLLDTAVAFLAKSPVFRAGANASGRIPTEHAALALLLRQPGARERVLAAFPAAGLPGQLYFSAFLAPTGGTPPGWTPGADKTALLVDGGNLIVLEPASVLHQDFVASGALLAKIRASFPAP